MKKECLKTFLTIREVQSLIKHELGTNIQGQFNIGQITEAIETYKNNMSKG
jgi:hypothetical protein